MKVLEVTNVDFSLRQFLLPTMRALRARGHEVIGACAEGHLLDDVRAEGFRVVALPFARSLSPVAHWRALAALVRLMRAERPDVVHAHMPISAFLTRVAARIAGVPKVAFTCHGYLHRQSGSWLRRVGGFAMEWIGGKLTDVYMNVSREEAVEARRWWIHRGAVAVGNGRNPALFRPDPAVRARLRADMGVAPGTVAVVIVSRIVATKGYIELLAAMRDVPAELWVVGERLASDRGEALGPHFDGFAETGRLRLLGYRTDVADILAAADIFVLPSHFEGLPMSVIEAMLAGLPVVATDIRGPREQVVAGKTGLLVPVRDPAALAVALKQLAEDDALRADMGAAGLARARALYDETRVVAHTIALMGL
ncbi:MAG: glycosyltransferase family 4 protein [Alphaproteobacteria bacterium]|nr:glycosyltransferase family 4 protein [Alphaproteobacteria bacterium]